MNDRIVLLQNLLLKERRKRGQATTPAHAQFGGIFSAILGMITGPIGGALTDINQIRQQMLKTEQSDLYQAVYGRNAEKRFIMK